MVKKIKEYDRNRPSRKMKNIILLATEGNNKTEVNYFSEFNRSQNRYRIEMARGNKTDPEGIVRDMIRSMDREGIDFEFGDKAVCVFDTDFKEYRNNQIESARQIAKEYGIDIFTSNPCFEVWFLEHFRYTSKHFNSNQEVIDELKREIPGYTKSSHVSSVLAPKREVAIENCRRLEKYHDQAGNKAIHRNPSSEVYRLVQMITDEKKA